MEQYEVDLRDYLRVMWERKWVIVGVLALALAVAAAYAYTRPDEYQATALIQLESKPNALAIDNPLTPQSVVNLSSQEALWAITLQQSPIEGPLARRSFQAEIIEGTPFISLSLRGVAPPERLAALLARHVAVTRDFVRDQVRGKLQEQIERIEQQEEMLGGRRRSLIDEIYAWIDLRLEALRQQRSSLFEQAESLLNWVNRRLQAEPRSASLFDQLLGLLGLGGGPEPNVQIQTGIYQASYATLFQRLQAIEVEISDLEIARRSRTPQPGSSLDERLLEVNQELADLAAEKDGYRQALEGDWEPIRTVDEPRALSAPVGPSRKTDLVVGGVLGLFLGVLLAFLVNYLSGEPVAPRPVEQPAESEPRG